jgi:hypothetical protein
MFIFLYAASSFSNVDVEDIIQLVDAVNVN